MSNVKTLNKIDSALDGITNLNREQELLLVSARYLIAKLGLSLTREELKEISNVKANRPANRQPANSHQSDS